jgi:hypothetical protein
MLRLYVHLLETNGCHKSFTKRQASKYNLNEEAEGTNKHTHGTFRRTKRLSFSKQREGTYLANGSHSSCECCILAIYIEFLYSCFALLVAFKNKMSQIKRSFLSRECFFSWLRLLKKMTDYF